MLQVCINEKKYRNKTVLRNINFQVNEGEMICILGGSGMGKSTLLKCILGQTHFRGFIRTNSNIVHVPQYCSLNENELVYDSVCCTARMDYRNRKSNRAIEKIACEMLRRFDIAKVGWNKIANISGGERKRLELVESLIRQTSDSYIIDEPDSGLDCVTAYSIIRSIRNIVCENYKKAIIVSHNVAEENLDLFHKVMVLAKDKEGAASIAYYGPFRQMKNHFSCNSVFQIIEKASGEKGAYYVEKYQKSIAQKQGQNNYYSER